MTVRHRLSYQKMKPELWPQEPSPPAPVETARFREAIGTLCGAMPPARLTAYAVTIQEACAQTGTDPFLLAALMYHQSGCRPKTPAWETRHGVTRIDIEMHAPHIRGGEYRYFVKEKTGWQARRRPLGALRFNKWQMEKIAPNLLMAAHLLRVLTDQHPSLDEAFQQKPHRHPVSHWFFGDRVRHTEPEDAVLTVRRRLIGYYRGSSPGRVVGEFRGIPLVSPLDGAPRLLLDYFGNKRGDRGSSGHQGIDLAGLSGEPVRAVADGRISFAGVDLKGALASRATTPKEAAAVPPHTLGKGGIWVSVSHGNGFRSCYMHLTELAVGQGALVKAGDIIGTLGNSGTLSSGPHLHLEFRHDTGGRADPAAFLSEILVSPFNAR